jgi:dihydroflavonol-4-reductase
MKALVTGAAGFIGSHVVKALLERGHSVRGLLVEGEDRRNLEGLDLEIVEGDVRDIESVRRVMQGCEVVFHLAGIYAIWMKDPKTIYDVNVEGSRNVFEVALEQKVKRVVFTTSQAVYGGYPRGTLLNESIELNPGRALEKTGCDYSLSKYRSHLLAEEYHQRGLDIVNVAPAAPFGPGDLRPTPTGLILLSIVNLPAFFYVDSVINPVDVRDVAEGHVLALEKGTPGRSYLLGSDENLSMPQLLSLVKKVTGVRKLCLRVPVFLALFFSHVLKWIADHLTRKTPLITPGAVRVARRGFKLDCSRARNELGMPTRPGVDTVREALAWFARHGYIKRKKLTRKLTTLSGG